MLSPQSGAAPTATSLPVPFSSIATNAASNSTTTTATPNTQNSNVPSGSTAAGATPSTKPRPQRPTYTDVAPLPPPPKSSSLESDASLSTIASAPGGVGLAGSNPTTKAKSTDIPNEKPYKGIPNYRVNDDSRIDITACEHEFEVSMARSDFSAQSTESSMSAGYAGFSVTVSAGFSSRSESSSKTTTNTYQKTLIARYLYPRCDLFLYSDDIEPTPELIKAVEKVRKSKNINDLRKLHADFGHLFCQNLTLGGRLQSTKIIKTDTLTTEQEQKEQFKVSVGVSVSTPIGIGASMKHEEEKGSTQSQNTMDKKTNENNIFEAVGGDTILANNPAAWAPTVAKHEYWRVINRDELTPLADALSGIPGYEDVKSYFIQAVPALSKYIELDESRQVMTRFRLTAPLNGLSLKDKPNPAYYLGHKPTSSTTPRMMSVNTADISRFWGLMIEYSEETPLFNPKTFRAPVLLGYTDNKVGSTYFGAKYEPEYTYTQWNITAPFSDSLTHGARVTISTHPYTSPSPSPAQTDPTTTPLSTPPPAHMVVFRTAQGVFLPAMSESDTPQYWRILKANGAATPGEHIKEGDTIRLCWAFADQTTGFRDYVDDVFGRRRAQCPPELERAVLFMKLPWPRFESQQVVAGTDAPAPNSMVMVPVAATEPAAVELPVLPAEASGAGAYKYVAQDVQFRVDVVGGDGFGDTEDYMLRDVAQEGVANRTVRYEGLISGVFYL
ncbi:uncharacterized protein BDZ99DRAFT_414359 [Mytilinidion resinicola]|uniref:MACPF domain-containing protein n=1 Tax=Mytilinidion resinicola TaxID=574789 RepID=A0A6A6YSA7_9PEZI|nr:uncharacterized protein BDZ99DRAFT_414359 [Mytilinidion resinicola]KAF2811812.1 hypothetical protein BDZ99DRAFT_414359 [Mytilinidion resinicola]